MYVFSVFIYGREIKRDNISLILLWKKSCVSRCHSGVRNARKTIQWIVFSGNEAKNWWPPVEEISSVLRSTEREWSPQWGAMTIEVAGISPGKSRRRSRRISQPAYVGEHNRGLQCVDTISNTSRCCSRQLYIVNCSCVIIDCSFDAVVTRIMQTSTKMQEENKYVHNYFRRTINEHKNIKT